jgi:predicted RNase H-like nuclease
MAFVESLRTSTPSLDVSANNDWAEFKRAVENATYKAELRRVEDPVDAVLCAYIGRYATERPDDVTVYGETTTGCIVTPTYRPSPSSR